MQASRVDGVARSVAAPRLVFVGTGGGAHQRRCHAAVAVQPAPDRVLLLDTAGGFEVVDGLRRAGIDLGAVTRIFLSHRHSDHILGLEPLLLHIGLEAMWARRRTADVHVYGEGRVLEAARAILEATSSLAVQLIGNAGGRVLWRPVVAGETVRLWPEAALTPFPADHIPDDGTNLGCAVDLADPARPGKPFRVVYSADSRPTATLRRVARGADALIHEAGGLDAERHVVVLGGHSTAGEAARQARAAGVGRLYLFHVPDDAGVPGLLAEARREFPGPVAVPDDGDVYPLLVRPLVEPASRPAGFTAGAESPPAPPSAG
jgi:ribonuclease Z